MRSRSKNRFEDAGAEFAIGEYDGLELGEGWFRFYIYGNDANLMADIVLRVVKNSSPPIGSFAVKRFGPQGAPQEAVPL
jgi:hypothetical protein